MWHRYFIRLFLTIKCNFLVTIFDELFRSEGVKQVYAIVTEWMAELDDAERKKIKWILYDDMCHLGPFSQNPVVLNINKITRFFGTRNLAVDCLYFLNHKDKVFDGLFFNQFHSKLIFLPEMSVCV